MTITLVRHVDVARALTVEEVDGNWDAIIAAFAAVATVNITSVQPNEAGDGIEFIGTGGVLLGALLLPSPFVPVGPWLTGAAYTTRHIVSVDGSAYLCSLAHTAGAVFATDLAAGKWQLLGSKGDQGDAGTGIVWSGNWDSGTAYTQGQGVTHSSSLWAALEATTAGEEPGVSSKWAAATGGGGAVTAADIAYTDTYAIGATNVQAALDAIIVLSGGG